jgi:hypothetical protein
MSRLLAHSTNLTTVSCYRFYCAQIISKLIIFRISRLYEYYSRTVSISPAGYIFNTDPAPTKEETLTINWVGGNVRIVFSELGSFAEDLKELRDEAPRGRLPFIYLTHKSNVLALWQSKRLCQSREENVCMVTKVVTVNSLTHYYPTKNPS